MDADARQQLSSLALSGHGLLQGLGRVHRGDFLVQGRGQTANLIHQQAAAFDLIKDHLKSPTGVLIGGLTAQALGEAEDRRQGIVELVGQTPGQMRQHPVGFQAQHGLLLSLKAQMGFPEVGGALLDQPLKIGREI